MIRFLFCFLMLFFCLLPVFGEVPECDRPQTADIYEYKDTYVPVEYAPEPFGMEVADLVVLTVFMLIAGWFSLKRKPARWISLLMVAGLIYFGFIRGGCICPVGATTNFCIGLAAPELIGKVIALLFLLPLIAAFFLGRVFCSSACPIGALQHLLSRKKGYVLSPQLNAMLRLLPIALLGVTVWGALRSGIFIACKLDVYKLLFFTGHAWIDQAARALAGTLTDPHLVLIGDLAAWLILCSTLLIGVFVPRPFCRFLCPYSVLLGVASALGLRRRRVDPEACVNCRQCDKTCPVQAISTDSSGQMTISGFHCIQCGRCDRICRKSAFRG